MTYTGRIFRVPAGPFAANMAMPSAWLGQPWFMRKHVLRATAMAPSDAPRPPDTTRLFPTRPVGCTRNAFFSPRPLPHRPVVSSEPVWETAAFRTKSSVGSSAEQQGKVGAGRPALASTRTFRLQVTSSSPSPLVFPPLHQRLRLAAAWGNLDRIRLIGRWLLGSNITGKQVSRTPKRETSQPRQGQGRRIDARGCRRWDLGENAWRAHTVCVVWVVVCTPPGARTVCGERPETLRQVGRGLPEVRCAPLFPSAPPLRVQSLQESLGATPSALHYACKHGASVHLLWHL